MRASGWTRTAAAAALLGLPALAGAEIASWSIFNQVDARYVYQVPAAPGTVSFADVRWNNAPTSWSATANATAVQPHPTLPSSSYSAFLTATGSQQSSLAASAGALALDVAMSNFASAVSSEPVTGLQELWASNLAIVNFEIGSTGPSSYSFGWQTSSSFPELLGFSAVLERDGEELWRYDLLPSADSFQSVSGGLAAGSYQLTLYGDSIWDGSAESIFNNGRIAFSVASTVPVAAPIPEPETYAMLLAGLALLALRRRILRRAAAP